MALGFNWRVKGNGLKPIKIPYTFAGCNVNDDFIQSSAKPFFHLLTEKSTVKLFLDAVAHNIEDAQCFLSKNCIKKIDLSELQKHVDDVGFKYLVPDTSDESENVRTNTVMLINKKNQEKMILRLYMVREPDQFGQWKIFSVEQA